VASRGLRPKRNVTLTESVQGGRRRADAVPVHRENGGNWRNTCRSLSPWNFPVTGH